jgi:hypothetical protein
MMEGFHIFTLPFAEDSRSFAQVFTPPSEDGWPLASQKQVDAAKDFVKALTIRNFKPDAFPNPGFVACGQ